MTERPASSAFDATDCPPELKQRIFARIDAHVREKGHRDWHLVREDPAFASIIGRAAGSKGHRKFFRWVKAVGVLPPPDKTRPHEARQVAAGAMAQATKAAREAVQMNLPAAPSPAYLLRSGADGARNIDFMARLQQLWGDVDRLREHAMRFDESHPAGSSIADPDLFDRAIRRSREVLETTVRAMSEIWNLSFQKRFYDGIETILEEELGAFPDIRTCVVGRLKELNDRTGLTLPTEAGR